MSYCPDYDSPNCKRFRYAVGAGAECPKYEVCRTPQKPEMKRKLTQKCVHHRGEAPSIPHKGPCCVPQICVYWGPPMPIPKGNCGYGRCSKFETRGDDEIDIDNGVPA